MAHTDVSFVDRLTYHRQEIVRTLYEFLIGDANAKEIAAKPKSEAMLANDAHYLYLHAARCPAIMQLFLDRNPIYWCFVPVPKDTAARTSPFTRPLAPSPTPQVSAVLRADAQVARLLEHVPRPGHADYTFSPEQVHEQKAYFKFSKDRQPVNMHQTNFYNGTVVAVLPEHCSESLQKFVEALFVTHAECALNRDGRLINQPAPLIDAERGLWYRDLIRPPTHSSHF